MLQLVNSAAVVIVKHACDRCVRCICAVRYCAIVTFSIRVHSREFCRSSKSHDALHRDPTALDSDQLSPTSPLSSAPTSAAAAAAAAQQALNAPATTGSTTATLELAVTAVVEAARVLCSRSNARSSSIAHSIALQLVRLCSAGDVLWRTLDDAAAVHLLQDSTRFLCDVVALGGRNVELSIARAVAAAGDA